MTKQQVAELKSIANRLARRSNDPAAMNSFDVLVRSISQTARRDLVVVLQEMIAEARSPLPPSAESRAPMKR